ncbi:hypothetical protein DPMN_131159 [Dreissena polymorpha]|uniref:Uncharacterized protein n=1 Tax=Dreissena polymorpha TaxID=45954 RepID=A0A9D4H811_DREPO|nr:hypothetical protein DPMN_131159 [Dreissena polymorpha]
MNTMMYLLYIEIILLFIGSSGFLLDTFCSTGNVCRCDQHSIECTGNRIELREALTDLFERFNNLDKKTEQLARNNTSKQYQY